MSLWLVGLLDRSERLPLSQGSCVATPLNAFASNRTSGYHNVVRHGRGSGSAYGCLCFGVCHLLDHENAFDHRVPS